MFWDAPGDHQPSAAEQDLATRLQPSGLVRHVGAAMLQAAPDAKQVVVGLALPGKQRGVWTTGQPVLDVPGYWLVHNDDELRAARECADRAGAEVLAGVGGTTAHAYIDATGYCAVFEGLTVDKATPKEPPA